MPAPLRLAALLVFFAFPLLELFVLVKAAETIGFWPTFGLLVAAAALGVAVIRARGMTMVVRMFDAMGDGRLPFEPVLDSYAVIAAGFLLILPGFLSDAIALLLLIAPLRHAFLRWMVPSVVRRAPPRRAAPQATVIDGTWEHVEDKDPKSGDPH